MQMYRMSLAKSLTLSGLLYCFSHEQSHGCH
ncbi:rCG46245, isoform CRA_a [Rattus norvegicus]|uniref:RCG46245, isoform CRA_a n=1 Tax=Rattus norvegicus TaxID=10116 RepID=A6ID29_RAT|nr:rCG46245, isoform CRA_a [Rattus norvegicus]